MISTLFISHASIAQQAKEANNLSALDVGQAIPDELWDAPIKVVNDPNGKSTINLKDYKGKLIILDFWGTYCASCIQNFPKMEQLQSTPEFKDRIKILAITKEKESKINSFFSSEVGKDYTYVHSVVEDTIMNNFFPHRTIPHMVWILPDGSLFNTTSSGEVTEQNIRALLSKKNTKMAIKKDLEYNKHLFLEEEVNLNDHFEMPFYQIFVKGAYPGLPSQNKFWKNEQGKAYGRQFINKSLGSIYYSIASELFEKKGVSFNQNRIINRTSNKYLSNPLEVSKLPYKERILNTYSYELVVPKDLADSLYDYMLEDLNRYTSYRAKLDNFEQDCYILTSTSKNNKLQTSGGKYEFNFGDTKQFIRNYPMVHLVSILNSLQSVVLPVIDETGYTGNLDMNFQNVNNLDLLKADLLKYGLELRKTTRPLMMLIIKDK